METKRLLNKIPEDVLSEKRFLDRISSRNLLEKDQEKDLSSIKFFKMMDYKIAEPTVEDLMVEIENIKENKLEDSNKYKIHPDDTPSQICLNPL